MPTLILLRHAKASAATAGLDDFDRALTNHGAADAAAAGAVVARWKPELALVSAARRTRETWTIASAAMAPQPQLIVELDLYLCSANAILARLAAIGPAIGSVVLVGHNPDLHEVALRLAGDPAGREGRALRHKFPTAAIAVFDLPGADWRIPAPGGAKLAQFWTPPQH